MPPMGQAFESRLGSFASTAYMSVYLVDGMVEGFGQPNGLLHACHETFVNKP